MLAVFVIAFIWFIWIAPLKHIYSRTWNREHSKLRYWEEAQKSVHRIGITHDVGIEIGYWGGKDWVVWIMQHIKPGQVIDGCEASHLGESLAAMTNQQLEPKAEVWLAWWTTNQNKSQLEWIKAGFADKGIFLQQPLTTNNIFALLKLSRLDTNSPVIANTPRHLRSSLRYNAFRWLRDSNFDARYLDLKTIPDEDRNQITLALIQYAEWFGEHYFDPGKLPVSDYRDYETEPMFMGRQIRWTLYLVLAVLTLSGLWLVRYKPN